MSNSETRIKERQKCNKRKMGAAASIAAGKAPAWHNEANDGPQRAKKTARKKNYKPPAYSKKPMGPKPHGRPPAETPPRQGRPPRLGGPRALLLLMLLPD